LIAFALFHSVLAVVAVVFTARRQHYVAAPIAAALTMTAWGWFVFTALSPIVWILGVMAGISIGTWALFMFRSLDVKAMFADGEKPGPLDRFSTPRLAGAAVGLLAVILGIGGVLYVVAREKSNGVTQSGSQSGGRQEPGSRQMPGTRQMPEPRQMKSRTGDPVEENGEEVTLDDLNDLSFVQIAQRLGQPTELHRSKKRQNLGLAIWASGNDKYTVVGFLESIDGKTPTLVMSKDVNRTRSIVDNMKRAIDK